MFKFFDQKGVLVFSSKNISEVESEALKYKIKNSLKIIEIVQGRGKFYKFV